MAPYKQPGHLLDLSFVVIRDILVDLITDHLFFFHDVQNGEIREGLEESVREDVQGYLGNMLPSALQTQVLTMVLEVMELKCPHLVVQLLFTERMKQILLPLTSKGEGQSLIRVSELDITRTLETFDEIFKRTQPSEFKCLTDFLIVDRSEDPDFQGDPINNMINTSTSRDTVGIMVKLESLSDRLSLAPNLTQLVLPFTSDNMLVTISWCPSLATFQNIYRSTVTEVGLLSLTTGPARHTLTRLLLSLNSHSRVPGTAVTSVLLSCPLLQVLELGGAGRTKSLYFQGGDAKRRHTVYSSLAEILTTDPHARLNLGRILLFLETNTSPDLQPLVRGLPQLKDLTLFGWDEISLNRSDWSLLVTRLVRLELVGLGLRDSSSPGHSSQFDVQLLTGAVSLRQLEVAGWGDTHLDLGSLLATLPQLNSLYLEDVKLSLSSKITATHQLTQLTIFHCSTNQMELVHLLPLLVPHLASLTVSSLYRDDPTRGLPFHFHLPRQEGRQEALLTPVVDLKILSGMKMLERLHLNVSYPAQLVDHDFSLAALLIRDFPSLKVLSLDNYVGRTGSPLTLTFHRARINQRLRWFLHQHNREVAISLS